MERLVKFIGDNGLNFNGKGSDLNGNCCVISGYADYIGVTKANVIEDAIKVTDPRAKNYSKELKRVFKFAYTYNYGNFWKTDAAKKLYKF